MSELAISLIVLGAKYGVPWLQQLIQTANAPSVTADDLLKVLAIAKPYSYYFPESAPPVEAQPPSPTPPAA